ncbi:MAG: hypothetical protein AAF654_02055 [Myxococcota bacterium]
MKTLRIADSFTVLSRSAGWVTGLDVGARVYVTPRVNMDTDRKARPNPDGVFHSETAGSRGAEGAFAHQP